MTVKKWGPTARAAYQDGRVSAAAGIVQDLFDEKEECWWMVAEIAAETVGMSLRELMEYMGIDEDEWGYEPD